MDNNFNILFHHPLFEGISQVEFSSIIKCIGGYEKEYNKNQYIIHAGNKIDFVGIVISGDVSVIKIDEEGNENIITKVSSGDMFAEVFACANIFHSPVSIVASSKSKILFFDYRKIISTCNSSCSFHQKLIGNMLKIIARKTLYLNQKIDIISQKTLRDKIMLYFNYERKGAKKFTIEMNREQLAKFLCSDRSALSNELSKMQKDGVIIYNKNDFEILD